MMKCRLLIVFMVLLGFTFCASATKRIKRQQTSCPVNCNCFIVNSVEKRVECFNAGQIDVPAEIPGDVKFLNLSRNDIQRIRKGKFDNFRFLSSLDLSHNSITEIDKAAFKDLESLTYLDISYNKISNASLDELRQSSRILRHLNISATSLHHVPELRDPAGVYLKNLTHLSMGSNFFTQIPPNYLPRSLQYLDISCLRMRTFPNTALTGLSELQELNLQGCDGQKVKITAMEGSALASSKKLIRLNLRNNQLAVVPHDLPQSLEELDLSENRLLSVKNGVCATQEQLRLSFGTEGGASQVGSPLSHLIHLKKLKLNDNKINSICVDDFVGMEELRELNLTNCGLYSFHRQAFLYAPSLTILDLSNNRLTKFLTEELAMMEYMYVSYNLITEVSNFDRRTFPSLIESDFSGNPFRCNCDLKPFVDFLSFSGGVRFRNLHAFSKHYSCAVPSTVKGKPILRVDFTTEVSCAEKSSINIPTIAAPVSLVGGIILIVIIMAIYKKTQDKKTDKKSSGMCCGSCCPRNDKNQQKVVISQAQKYNASSDILIQQNAFLNDAAILCHVKDHKWVINRMVPSVHQHREFVHNSSKRSSSVSIQFNSGRRLNMEVFTIAESIKIDNLNKCIDSNRKIVLVVTQEFINEGSCLFLLKAIREKMKFDPKDAVVVVILDAIPWSSMPQDLQNLMVEKSFLQVPRDGNEKQEFTFWDNLCSYIGSITSRAPKQTSPQEIPTNIPALPPKTTSNVSQSHFAPARRAGEIGMEEIHSQSATGETRDQRLRRLGLNQSGGVADPYNSDMIQRNQLMSVGRQHQPISPNNSVADHRDLDNLYSLKNEPPKVVYGGTTGGRVRSLLPAHAGDADSLYSEDEEAIQEVRPQYRAEAEPQPHTHSTHQLPSYNGFHHNSNAFNPHQPISQPNTYLGKSSNSEELLHGTTKSVHQSGMDTLPSSVGGSTHPGHFNDAMDMSGEPEPIPVADESTAEEDNNDGTMDSRKKKKGMFGKLFKKK